MRSFQIQNLEEDRSLRGIVVTHIRKGRDPFPVKVDPQRALSLALDENMPMVIVSIGEVDKQAFPDKQTAEEAEAAGQLQAQVDGLTAENRQLRVDRDTLNSEVERLRSATAQHDPSHRTVEIDTLKGEHKSLTDTYNKTIDTLREVEKERDELRQQVKELQGGKSVSGAETGAGTGDNGDGDEPKLEDLTKAELLKMAAEAGVYANDNMKKADIIERLQAAERRKGMLKDELIAEAESRQIEVSNGMTKDEILDALNKAA